MKKNLILPKKGFRYNRDTNSRIYFLAGPVRGGGDWQSTAINRLNQLDSNCEIVCPCRYPADHPMSDYAIKTDVGLPTSQIEFESQTKWERYYLELASKYGAIIFWLGLEDVNNPRPKESGPYSRDTYGELGRWSIRSARDKARVVVGANPRFSGLKAIQENFDGDHGFSFRIYHSLEFTLKQAVKLAGNT